MRHSAVIVKVIVDWSPMACCTFHVGCYGSVDEFSKYWCVQVCHREITSKVLWTRSTIECHIRTARYYKLKSRPILYAALTIWRLALDDLWPEPPARPSVLSPPSCFQSQWQRMASLAPRNLPRPPQLYGLTRKKKWHNYIISYFIHCFWKRHFWFSISSITTKNNVFNFSNF